MSVTTSINCADLVFDDGILYIRFKSDIEIGLNDVREIYLTGLKLSGGKPYPALADLRNDPASTPEARAYGAAAEYAESRLADALLTGSLATRLVSNSYIKFNKPKVPTRAFTSEQEALKWLKGFLK